MIRDGVLVKLIGGVRAHGNARGSQQVLVVPGGITFFFSASHSCVRKRAMADLRAARSPVRLPTRHPARRGMPPSPPSARH